MTQNQSVDATFTQSSYTLTASISGQGSITSTDGFINCPGTCSHTYLSLTQVTLNEFPAQGWIFSGWSGACSGVGPCNVTMLQNQAVTASLFSLGLAGFQFSPVTPCRLVDTRQTHDPIQGGTSQNFSVRNSAVAAFRPAPTAYSLNVTVVPHGLWVI